MSDFTIRNLRTDVEDAAPAFGMAPEVEARFARDPLECENMGLSFQRLASNARMPFGHRHSQQEEVYLVLEGHGRVKLDDEIRELRPWDAVRVASQTMRCFEGGPEGMTFVVFGAPKTSPADVEMVPSWWSD